MNKITIPLLLLIVFNVLIILFLPDIKIKLLERKILQSNDSMLIKSYSFISQNYDLKAQSLLLKKSNGQYNIIHDINFSIDKLNKDIPENIFFEYLLPPVIDKEKYNKWKSICYEEFHSLTDINTKLACDSIYRIVFNNFEFTYHTFTEERNWTNYSKKFSGDCFDIARAVLFPYRAIGYASTYDYVIAWGNANGSHAWNKVFMEGEMINIAGKQTDEYFSPFSVYDHWEDTSKSGLRRPAKILRKTFSINRKYETIKKKIKPSPYIKLFANINFLDVTNEYFEVEKITIPSQRNEKHNVLFLSVFNQEKWIPIAAEIKNENNEYIFHQMNKEMLYIPSCMNGKPLTNPLILESDGSVTSLNPEFESKTNFTMLFLKPRLMEYGEAWGKIDILTEDIFSEIANDNYREKPINGTEYNLYYFDMGWKFLSSEIAKEEKIVFKDLPKNALLLLKDEKDKIIGRCFTVTNGECQWW